MLEHLPTSSYISEVMGLPETGKSSELQSHVCSRGSRVGPHKIIMPFSWDSAVSLLNLLQSGLKTDNTAALITDSLLVGAQILAETQETAEPWCTSLKDYLQGCGNISVYNLLSQERNSFGFLDPNSMCGGGFPHQ